jgi:hypothetical protein
LFSAVLILLIYLIVIQVREYYQQKDPMLKVIKETIIPLHEKVYQVDFYEGNKSYTINKKKIYLCLKDENNEYYDFNMLIYVAIHELSHVLCDEIGHTPKFNQIFQDNLFKAEQLGIYDSNKPVISNYCGHQ